MRKHPIPLYIPTPSRDDTAYRKHRECLASQKQGNMQLSGLVYCAAKVGGCAKIGTPSLSCAAKVGTRRAVSASIDCSKSNNCVCCPPNTARRIANPAKPIIDLRTHRAIQNLQQTHSSPTELIFSHFFKRSPWQFCVI